MASTGASNNIVHISFRKGGFALCKSRFACFTTTVDNAHTWPAVCKRCMNKLTIKAREEIESKQKQN